MWCAFLCFAFMGSERRRKGQQRLRLSWQLLDHRTSWALQLYFCDHLHEVTGARNDKNKHERSNAQAWRNAQPEMRVSSPVTQPCFCDYMSIGSEKQDRIQFWRAATGDGIIRPKGKKQWAAPRSGGALGHLMTFPGGLDPVTTSNTSPSGACSA